MILILLAIQLLLIFFEYFFSGNFNLISIMIVLINTSLSFIKFKKKIFNTIIVVIFLIHLFLVGFMVFNGTVKSNRYVGTRCPEAFNCDCKDGEKTCQCDYLKDYNDPNTKIRITCPNQNEE